MDSSLFRKFWLHYMKIDFHCERSHPYGLVLISELSKRSRLCHFDFNVLKCNICVVINIWQKSYSEQFQSSNLHNVAEVTFIVFP